MTNLAKPKTSFWNQLETKQISSRNQIEQFLMAKLGTPTNELQTNLLFELTKKITSYYQEEIPKNYTIYTLTGSVNSPTDILERKFRDGKRMGQTYYILKIGNEKLQATEQELEPSKWEQITKLAIVGKELVFKYRKFYQNKQLLDYYPTEKGGVNLVSPTEREGKANIGIEQE